MPNDPRAIQSESLTAFTAEVQRVFPHLAWTTREADRSTTVDGELSYSASAATDRGFIEVSWCADGFAGLDCWDILVEPVEDTAISLEAGRTALIDYLAELLGEGPAAPPADQRDTDEIPCPVPPPADDRDGAADSQTGWLLIGLTARQRKLLAAAARRAAEHERGELDPKGAERSRQTREALLEIVALFETIEAQTASAS